MRSELKKVATIIIGATILAFGSYNFNYQNSVTEGGVLGLLLLIKNVFDISPSLTSLVIDLSLFALGTKFFGKNFYCTQYFQHLHFQLCIIYLRVLDF
nr:YitT family protein [Paraclostridium sp. AKS73]